MLTVLNIYIYMLNIYLYWDLLGNTQFVVERESNVTLKAVHTRIASPTDNRFLFGNSSESLILKDQHVYIYHRTSKSYNRIVHSLLTMFDSSSRAKISR